MGQHLVGRETELAELADRLRDGGAVAVAGPAGIGKSALAAHAAAQQSGEVLTGAALAHRFASPYLPLATALHLPVLRGEPAEVAARVEAPLRGATLLLDDLHWSDPATLSVLGLLRGVTSMLVTVRSATPISDEVLERLDAAGFTVVHLDGLSDRAATDLLQRAAVHDPSRADVAAMVRQAGGNPLLILALAGDPRLRTASRAVISARVLRLSPPARRLLARITLEGTSRPPGLAAGPPTSGSGTPGAAGPPAEPPDWQEVRSAGLVRDERDEVVVDHQLYGEAALASLTASELAAIHAELAAVSTDPAVAADHLLHAGQADRALSTALELADRAATAVERAQLLSLAASASDRHPHIGARSRAQVHLRAARALQAIGEMRRAEAMVSDLAPEEAHLRAEVAHLRAQVRFVLDPDPAEVRALLEGALGALRSGREASPALEIQLLVLLARLHARVDLDARTAGALAEEALALAERHQRCLGLATGMVGTVRMLTGHPEATGSLRRALSLAHDEEDHDAAYQLAASLGLDRFLRGDWTGARAVYEDALARAEDGHHLGWQRELQLYLARTKAFGTAELEGAATELRALHPEAALTRNTGMLLCTRVIVEAALGESATAHAVLSEARRRAEPNPTAQSMVHWAAAHLAWLETDLEATIEHARRAHAAAAGFPTTDDAVVLWAWAEHELGREVTAPAPTSGFALFAGAGPERRALEVLRTSPAQAGDLLEEAHAAHCVWSARLRCRWGQVQARSSVPDGPQLEDLRSALRTEADRYGCTRGWAARLATTGHGTPDGAFAPAAPGVDPARAGPRATASTPADPSGRLDPFQHEILLLVAAGLRSRGIAERLGVTTSQVDRAIRAARATLGARTRAEAAAVVAATAAAAES